jgi:anti-sigma factor RsiW
MNRCPETPNVQDWLDGTLEPDAAARFEAHQAGCPECEAEATAYRVVFSELRSLPLLDPRPELFERIMAEVLPHRAPRWVRVLGWGYAAALTATVAAIGSAFVLPGPSAWMHGIIAAATRSLTGTGTFVLRSLSDGLARVGETLAGAGNAGRLLKLLWTALTNPAVLVTIVAAIAVCAGLLWWMRPRERRESGEIPHVGLLGLF